MVSAGGLDLDTADYMFAGGRYFYAVFMCYLAIEKALKGLHVALRFSEPPRTHNLTYLVERLEISVPPETDAFLAVLSGLSVPTRYPDDLKRLAREFNRSKTESVLTRTKETLNWTKTLLTR